MLALGAGIVAIVIFSGLFFFTGKSLEDHYGLAQRFALVAAIVLIGALALALVDLYGRQRLLGRMRTLEEGSPVDRRANVAEGGEMQSGSQRGEAAHQPRR